MGLHATRLEIPLTFAAAHREFEARLRQQRPGWQVAHWCATCYYIGRHRAHE